MKPQVWMYWEGECPNWIKASTETIFAHAPDAQLLTWDDFNSMWDVDRDIDLTALSVVHRSDFVRAFLLAKHGGLWIDTDCIVLNSLQPVLDLLTEYDFLSFTQRYDGISNAFTGARHNSKVANAYYQRVCTIIRSGQRIEWLSLGTHALQDAISQVGIPWLNLSYELVQPICWETPGDFFVRRERREHDAHFNERAVCYMLANTMFKKYQEEHPSEDLMEKETFFSYLLERAREAREPLSRTYLLAHVNPQDMGAQLGEPEMRVDDVHDTEMDVHRQTTQKKIDSAVTAGREAGELRNPPVSCICLTYGRPEVLEEAIYSFLQQEYAGRKELIVLNDYVGQTLHFDHPEVRVFNLPVRLHTVGEKMNAAVALASHDLLFVWDDDDIYLPHRLSFSVEHFDPQKGFFKPRTALVLDNGELRGPAHYLFHVGSCYSRKRFDAVGGYAHEGTGYDLLFEKRLEAHFPGSTATYEIRPEEIYYLYRWGGTGSYHMSQFGALKQGENVGHNEVESFVQQRASRGEIPLGDIPLQPSWKVDYRQLASSYVEHVAEKEAPVG